MSDRPRVRRKDPARSAPIRNWSNMFLSPSAQGVAAPSAHAAAAPTAADPIPFGPVASNHAAADHAPTGHAPADHTAPNPAPENPSPADRAVIDRAAVDHVASASEEARVGIEAAYRVIDEHLQEGRRAAQAQAGRGDGAGHGAFATPGSAGAGIATDSIQEMVAQGIRFYSTFAPLWASLINSIANSAPTRDTAAATTSGVPLAPPPMPRSNAAINSAAVIVEIASAHMTRVTVDLAANASPGKYAIGGLLALDAEKPPLKEVMLSTEPGSNRLVVRIRVPDSQPAGIYTGVIADRESGEPRGTLTLRISRE